VLMVIGLRANSIRANTPRLPAGAAANAESQSRNPERDVESSALVSNVEDPRADAVDAVMGSGALRLP